MVKIAVAGGTGNVATNMLKTTIASGHHDITIFTRSAPTKPHPSPKVTYQQVDYSDLGGLTATLKGFHTVLSFFVVHLDVDNVAQKNLIHASIAAGVSRFAPSEWGIASNSGVSSYDNKDYIASYLASLDSAGELKGMQYCLFQPSIFTDYFAHPYPLEPELITWAFFVDFENRRAMVLDDGMQPIVLTAIQDDANILAKALDDTERPWPRVGGIRGCRTNINELVELGKKIRGGEWTIEYLKSEDVAKGVIKSSWIPPISHPTIPEGEQEAFSKLFIVMFFRAIKSGAWDVSAEFNERYPDYKFMSAEEYLTKAWEGKP
ncbi:NAD(P)-binding protein [Stemphylium lycopersici]|uniref:NAD(P)-binding protein n=1 Tax=Stemphylium lycopersici TaxID=183478 RepID=A0A364N5M5_STELY|nr:NAD(P)-binding protein [Stemphylium lycopersici]RAR12624.1 NAD(P)-binding protein [Stemphylium lycopersici]